VSWAHFCGASTSILRCCRVGANSWELPTAPHLRRSGGPKPDAAARQIKHLNLDNARLRRRLERAELIIDAQKKLCVALGLPTADETSGDE